MKERFDSESLRSFFELCLKAKSPDTLKQLFDLFFTIEEKETLVSRYMIIKALLEEELPQREIAENYKVSISQITRGSNALKIIDKNLFDFLKKYIK